MLNKQARDIVEDIYRVHKFVKYVTGFPNTKSNYAFPHLYNTKKKLE